MGYQYGYAKHVTSSGATMKTSGAQHAPLLLFSPFTSLSHSYTLILTCFVFNRQQHHETMQHHIETCLKNADSKRRLRVIYDLRVAATSKQKTTSGAVEITTLGISGFFSVCRLLSGLIHDVLSKHQALNVEVSHLEFGNSKVKSRCAIILRGPAYHVKAVVVKVQVSACWCGFLLLFSYLCVSSSFLFFCRMFAI